MKMISSAFYLGFEKAAFDMGSAVKGARNLLAGGIKGTRSAGAAVANKGLDMATRPGAGTLTQGAGKALTSVGNFARKNPKATMAMGAGATAVAANQATS